MEPDDLIKAITASSSVRDFVEANILSGIPWIFQGDTALFTAWRTAVAKEVGVAPDAIYLVGSAATGYSLNPTKPGENFRKALSGASPRPSDLDIAIVAPNFFEQAWNSIIRFDRGGALGRFLREQYGYKGFETGDDIRQMRQNVYWGAISYVHATSGADIARTFRYVFAATTRIRPLFGHQPKARIYRRREDLLSYHEQGVQLVKERLTKRGAYK